MKLGFILRQPDFYVALCISICSAVAVVSLFINLSAASQSSSLIEYVLFPGSKSFLVQTPFGCAGTIRTQFREEVDSFDLSISGDLALALDGKKIPIHFTFESAFALLGQLVIGVLNVSAEESRVRISLMEVDPIKVSIGMSSAQGSRKQEFPIPGPIEIQKARGGGYRLYYSKLSRSPQQMLGPLIQSFQESLPLEIREQSNEFECDPAHRIELDLTRLVREFKERYAGIAAKFLPGFGQ